MVAGGSRPSACHGTLIDVGANWLSNLIVGAAYPHIADDLYDYNYLQFVVTLVIFFLLSLKLVPEAPDKTFRQAKATGKINNEKSTLLFDSGAEVLILDAAFALKVGCYIDNGQNLECEGVGKNPYMVNGRTRVKLTLAGSLVYYFDVWVGPPTGGQDLILGMDFMVSAGRRCHKSSWMTTATLKLVGRLKSGRGSSCRPISNAGSPEENDGCTRSQEDSLPDDPKHHRSEVSLASRHSDRYVTRRKTRTSNTRICADGITSVSRLAESGVPSHHRSEVKGGASRRPDGPPVDHPLYETSLKILRRDAEDAKPIVAQVSANPPDEVKPEPRSELARRTSGSGRPIAGDSTSEGSEAAHDVRPNFEEPAPTLDTRPVAAQDDASDKEVCYHEGGDLFAKDVEREMAVLPEVTATTDEVTIEDIQVGDPTENTPEEIEQLRQIIWQRRHLLMGKGNALPPAAVGAVCDIDVGGAAPAAQRVRLVAPQFCKKLSDLIKRLLSAKMITPFTSPWASPIVIIMTWISGSVSITAS
ncbi:unnamed protein product [Phytophthora fragariaefolia]|uniref:Unnamed protein product n=1 Tax=Phytophthora fragariaefolia TaxID=1490495 RepID=A0A9W6TVZ1_9STRA|nr:unnamed protein product [Phytophthora fragariaefolia]